MTSTDPILSAGRRLAHTLLKKSEHAPDIEFIDVVTKASCSTIATEAGFKIRLDGLNGIPRADLAEVLAARVIHAAAHMLCIQAGVSSHGKSGKHTRAFEQAIEALGYDSLSITLNKSQTAAAEAFATKVSAMLTQRSTAHKRGTVACSTEGCTHTITLRESAIAKTRFLCVEHDTEMFVVEG